MDYFTKILRRAAIILLLAIFPLESGTSSNNAILNIERTVTIELKEITITAKKLRSKFTQKAKEFMGFKLEKSTLDTNIHSNLEEALKDFTGPKVIITSLKRHKWNPESKHRSGQAVDFQFSHELIEWLVSDVGAEWRQKFGLTFFIEGRPGSQALQRYKQNEKYQKFVFENEYATGNHVHINQ